MSRSRPRKVSVFAQAASLSTALSFLKECPRTWHVEALNDSLSIRWNVRFVKSKPVQACERKAQKDGKEE
jgi:hypothetical protein